MGYSLSKDSNVRYSKREQLVFSWLSKRQNPVSTDILLEKFQQSNGSDAYHVRNVLIGVLNSLSKKIEENDEPFRIKKSARKGPHPMEFRVEPT
jgi:hypothetical protein